MTEAGMIEATYFQPWHIGLYLFVVFVVMVVYYQWRWASICKANLQVLIAMAGGGGEFVLSPKIGSEVAIKNPHNDTVRMWPINELSTIEIPYPGVGFVPAFLQKTIRLVIVNEGDWEPMLNRSRHGERVASPDVLQVLLEIVEDIEDDEGSDATCKRIKTLVSKLSTAPTREMIASPAVLGNLMHEKITEAVITVNKEMIDQLAGITSRLSKVLNPLHFYIGMGLVLVLLGFIAFQIMPIMSSIGDLGDVSDKLDAIMKSLGIAGG